MKYYFLPDAMVVILTAICLVPIYYLVVRIFNASNWSSEILSILLLLLFAVLFTRTPYCTVVEKNTIKVKRIIGFMTIADISSIEPVTKEDFKHTVRTFGNGGFFGYTGYYKSSKLGKFRMLAINTKELAKVVTKTGQVIVINYPAKLFND
ncbi:MAG: hypothetical protein J6V02_04840 [Bacteroidaceae bacterium]|nr:hypothetical protein [Bacteroidaceae bacterium]